MNASVDTVKKEPQDIPITGRFDQYRSSFWAAALAGISIRYFPRPFLRQHWDSKEFAASPAIKKHAYSAIAGLFMEGVTGYYAHQTWQDMKSIFAQSLAWELDKKTEDLTYSDFKNSKNTIIKQTVDNYQKYNTWRASVQSIFFLPLLLTPITNKVKSLKFLQHPEAGVDLGVAANAAYLLHDVISRKITPFEELQALIDRKINQSDHFGDQFTRSDLLDIYERHAAEGSVHSFLYQRGTEKWEESMQLFERMADLINQTHKNTVAHERADFDFPKFIYLVGNGCIDPYHVEQSAAFIEIANKHGIGAVKKASQELKSGETLDAVLDAYDIKPQKLAVTEPETPSPLAVSMPEISASARDNFKALEDKEKVGLPYQEKILKTDGAHMGLSA